MFDVNVRSNDGTAVDLSMDEMDDFRSIKCCTTLHRDRKDCSDVHIHSMRSEHKRHQAKQRHVPFRSLLFTTEPQTFNRVYNMCGIRIS